LQVKQISVSEILPRTADLIFVNIKTYEGFYSNVFRLLISISDLPYTLELTLKGWRVASAHSDSMNGLIIIIQKLIIFKLAKKNIENGEKNLAV
jgi:hypothetical protein